MQKAFAAAESGQEGPDVPNLDFSLKPGETVSLKLNARVSKLFMLMPCCRPCFHFGQQLVLSISIGWILHDCGNLYETVVRDCRKGKYQFYLGCIYIQVPTPEKSFLSERLAAMSVSGNSAPAEREPDSRSSTDEGGASPLLPPPPSLCGARASVKSSSSRDLNESACLEISQAEAGSQHQDILASDRDKQIRDASEQQRQTAGTGNTSCEPVTGNEDDDEFGTFVG